jgi:hypothetical protein
MGGAAGQSGPPGRDPGRRPEPSELSERGEQGLGRISGAGPPAPAVVPEPTGHEQESGVALAERQVTVNVVTMPSLRWDSCLPFSSSTTLQTRV